MAPGDEERYTRNQHGRELSKSGLRDFNDDDDGVDHSSTAIKPTSNWVSKSY
jgi:hypothetical protein